MADRKGSTDDAYQIIKSLEKVETDDKNLREHVVTPLQNSCISQPDRNNAESSMNTAPVTKKHGTTEIVEPPESQPQSAENAAVVDMSHVNQIQEICCGLLEMINEYQLSISNLMKGCQKLINSLCKVVEKIAIQEKFPSDSQHQMGSGQHDSPPQHFQHCGSANDGGGCSEYPDSDQRQSLQPGPSSGRLDQQTFDTYYQEAPAPVPPAPVLPASAPAPPAPPPRPPTLTTSDPLFSGPPPENRPAQAKTLNQRASSQGSDEVESLKQAHSASQSSSASSGATGTSEQANKETGQSQKPVQCANVQRNPSLPTQAPSDHLSCLQSIAYNSSQTNYALVLKNVCNASTKVSQGSRIIDQEPTSSKTSSAGPSGKLDHTVDTYYQEAPAPAPPAPVLSAAPAHPPRPPTLTTSLPPFSVHQNLFSPLQLRHSIVKLLDKRDQNADSSSEGPSNQPESSSSQAHREGPAQSTLRRLLEEDDQPGPSHRPSEDPQNRPAPRSRTHDKSPSADEPEAKRPREE